MGPILTLNHKCTQFPKDEIGPNMKPVTEGWTYVVCLFDFLLGLSVCVSVSFFGWFYFRFFQLWTTIFDWTFAHRERERETEREIWQEGMERELLTRASWCINQCAGTQSPARACALSWLNNLLFNYQRLYQLS